MALTSNTRRDFLRRASGIPLILTTAPVDPFLMTSKTRSLGCICDVRGIKVGHYTDARRPTGCTVILTEEGATAGVDVRGSAPGTRETDLLNPLNTVEEVHAILLSGGSAFGLDAASGVVQFLEEKGIGYETRVAKVPIVPAAILYDLDLGNPAIRPDREAGYQACRNAIAGSCEEGNVGAGAGATVGKLFGFEFAMKSGIGTASIHSGPTIVGAIVAVNSVGDVINPEDGKIMAGARSSDGKKLLNAMEQIRRGNLQQTKYSKENTAIGVVATNAALSKSQVSKIAQMAHDGLARSINPVHTPVDGDTLFAISTHRIKNENANLTAIQLTQIGALAAETVAMAVCRAVLKAKGLPNLPSYSDLFGFGQRG
jgi:L-aminopeptidase/D-esterase-like protein